MSNKEPEQTTFDWEPGNMVWELMYVNEQAFIDAGHQREVDELKGRVGYLLSWDETRALGEVWGIFFGLQNEHEDGRNPTYQEMRLGFVECVERGEIDKALIVSAAKKFYTGKWWTYRSSVGYFDGDYDYKDFDIIRSDKEDIEKKHLKSGRDFFSLSVRDKRRLFGVPSDYLFIEDEAMSVIPLACDWLGIRIPRKEERFFKVASSSHADPLRSLTRRKVEKAAEGMPTIGRGGKDIYSLILSPGTKSEVKLCFEGRDVFDKYGGVLESADTDKLLLVLNDLISTSGTRKEGYEYTIPLDFLAEMWGVSNLDKLWNKVQRSAEVLLRTGLVQETDNAIGGVNILSGFYASKGRGRARGLTLIPSPLYASYVQNSPTWLMMPQKALELRSDNAYKMLRAFSLHKRRNLGAVEIAIENRLRVATLLELCDYPQPSELGRASRTKQQIASPFKRDLDKIVELGVFTGYKVLQNGTELSEDEFTSAKVMNNYGVFSSLVIEAIWNEAETPDYASIRQHKAENAARIEQGKTKRKTKTKG